MRHVIFNADDFGASAGVNRGIVEAHANGVVTSASLMTHATAAAEAAALAREHPALSVGLHWDVWGEDDRAFDLDDERAVRQAFDRQLDRFWELMERPPTHIDSHKHAHREVLALFRELAEPLDVPVRGDGSVSYVGGFYAQWEWKVTQLEYVSVGFLQRLLRDEVTSSWTEVGCHPGFHSDGFTSTYDREREFEVATLTDPAVRQTLEELGLQLASFGDYLRAHRAGTGR